MGRNIHIRAAYRYLCQSLSKREDLMELIEQMPAEQESSLRGCVTSAGRQKIGDFVALIGRRSARAGKLRSAWQIPA
jgi:hypothetical protein